MPVPGRQAAGPHRPGTGEMDGTMETRIERVHHHLRRPLAGRQELTIKKTPATHLKRQSRHVNYYLSMSKVFYKGRKEFPLSKINSPLDSIHIFVLFPLLITLSETPVR